MRVVEEEMVLPCKLRQVGGKVVPKSEAFSFQWSLAWLLLLRVLAVRIDSRECWHSQDKLLATRYPGGPEQATSRDMT